MDNKIVKIQSGLIMKMNIILKDVPPNTERQKDALEHTMQHVGNWLTGVWSANRGTNTASAKRNFFMPFARREK